MSHLIGLVGLPNKGKSTFFKAATLKAVDIANYPFTTIDPARGIAFVTAECPCKALNVKCSPKNSKCDSGTRLIPVELMDVAGLVEGAHEGAGMGNQFLDDLRQASALIQVVDASGKTNAKGEPVEDADPSGEVRVLEKEVDLWLFGIIQKSWKKVARMIKMEKKEPAKYLAENLASLGIFENHIVEAAGVLGLNIEDGEKWSEEDLMRFTVKVRELSKPVIVAANKIDVDGSEDKLKLIVEANPKKRIVPTCADAELALRNATDHRLIDYVPGAGDFNIHEDANLNDKQKQALEFLKDNVLKRFGSTGVQKCLNAAMFDLLDMIVVYPVENENKYSDKTENVLPDAKLVPRGTTAKELAYKIHTDIGENFIHAVDCKKHMRIKADHVLEDGDIVKIVSAAK